MEARNEKIEFGKKKLKRFRRKKKSSPQKCAFSSSHDSIASTSLGLKADTVEEPDEGIHDAQDQASAALAQLKRSLTDVQTQLTQVMQCEIKRSLNTEPRRISNCGDTVNELRDHCQHVVACMKVMETNFVINIDSEIYDENNDFGANSSNLESGAFHEIDELRQELSGRENLIINLQNQVKSLQEFTEALQSDYKRQEMNLCEDVDALKLQLSSMRDSLVKQCSAEHQKRLLSEENCETLQKEFHCRESQWNKINGELNICKLQLKSLQEKLQNKDCQFARVQLQHQQCKETLENQIKTQSKEIKSLELNLESSNARHKAQLQQLQEELIKKSDLLKQYETLLQTETTKRQQIVVEFQNKWNLEQQKEEVLFAEWKEREHLTREFALVSQEKINLEKEMQTIQEEMKSIQMVKEREQERLVDLLQTLAKLLIDLNDCHCNSQIESLSSPSSSCCSSTHRPDVEDVSLAVTKLSIAIRQLICHNKQTLDQSNAYQNEIQQIKMDLEMKQEEIAILMQQLEICRENCDKEKISVEEQLEINRQLQSIAKQRQQQHQDEQTSFLLLKENLEKELQIQVQQIADLQFQRDCLERNFLLTKQQEKLQESKCDNLLVEIHSLKQRHEAQVKQFNEEIHKKLSIVRQYEQLLQQTLNERDSTRQQLQQQEEKLKEKLQIVQQDNVLMKKAVDNFKEEQKELTNQLKLLTNEDGDGEEDNSISNLLLKISCRLHEQENLIGQLNEREAKLQQWKEETKSRQEEESGKLLHELQQLLIVVDPQANASRELDNVNLCLNQLSIAVQERLVQRRSQLHQELVGFLLFLKNNEENQENWNENYFESAAKQDKDEHVVENLFQKAREIVEDNRRNGRMLAMKAHEANRQLVELKENQKVQEDRWDLEKKLREDQVANLQEEMQSMKTRCCELEMKLQQSREQIVNVNKSLEAHRSVAAAAAVVDVVDALQTTSTTTNDKEEEDVANLNCLIELRLSVGEVIHSLQVSRQQFVSFSGQYDDEIRASMKLLSFWIASCAAYVEVTAMLEEQKHQQQQKEEDLVSQHRRLRLHFMRQFSNFMEFVEQKLSSKQIENVKLLSQSRKLQLQLEQFQGGGSASLSSSSHCQSFSIQQITNKLYDLLLEMNNSGSVGGGGITSTSSAASDWLVDSHGSLLTKIDQLTKELEEVEKKFSKEHAQTLELQEEVANLKASLTLVNEEKFALQNDKKQLESHWAGEEQRLNKQIQSLEQQVNSSQLECAILLQQRGLLQEQVSQQMQQTQKQMQLLRHENETLMQTLVRDLATSRREVDRLQVENKTLSTKHHESTRLLKVCEKNKDKFSKQVEEFREKNRQLQEEGNLQKEKINSLTNALHTLTLKEIELEKELTLLKARVATCSSTADNAQLLVNKLQQELTNCAQQVQHWRAQSENNQHLLDCKLAACAELTKNLDECKKHGDLLSTRLKTALDESHENVDKLLKEKENLLEEIQKKMSICEELRQDLDESEINRDFLASQLQLAVEENQEKCQCFEKLLQENQEEIVERKKACEEFKASQWKCEQELCQTKAMLVEMTKEADESRKLTDLTTIQLIALREENENLIKQKVNLTLNCNQLEKEVDDGHSEMQTMKLLIKQKEEDCEQVKRDLDDCQRQGELATSALKLLIENNRENYEKVFLKKEEEMENLISQLVESRALAGQWEDALKQSQWKCEQMESLLKDKEEEICQLEEGRLEDNLMTSQLKESLEESRENCKNLLKEIQMERKSCVQLEEKVADLQEERDQMQKQWEEIAKETEEKKRQSSKDLADYRSELEMIVENSRGNFGRFLKEKQETCGQICKDLEESREQRQAIFHQLEEMIRQRQLEWENYEVVLKKKEEDKFQRLAIEVENYQSQWQTVLEEKEECLHLLEEKTICCEILENQLEENRCKFQGQLKEKDEMIHKLAANVDDFQSQRDLLICQLEEKNEEISKVKLAVNQLNNDLHEKQTQLNECRRNLLKEEEILIITSSVAQLTKDLDDYRRQMEAIVDENQLQLDNILKEKEEFVEQMRMEAEGKLLERQVHFDTLLKEKEEIQLKDHNTMEKLLNELEACRRDQDSISSQLKTVLEENEKLLTEKKQTVEKMMKDNESRCEEYEEILKEKEEEIKSGERQRLHLMEELKNSKNQIEQLHVQLNLIVKEKENDFSTVQGTFGEFAEDVEAYQREMEALVVERHENCHLLLKEKEQCMELLTKEQVKCVQLHEELSVCHQEKNELKLVCEENQRQCDKLSLELNKTQSELQDNLVKFSILLQEKQELVEMLTIKTNSCNLLEKKLEDCQSQAEAMKASLEEKEELILATAAQLSQSRKEFDELMKNNELQSEAKAVELETQELNYLQQLDLINQQFELHLNEKETEISSINGNFKQLADDLKTYQREIETILDKSHGEQDNLLQEKDHCVELLNEKSSTCDQMESDLAVYRTLVAELISNQEKEEVVEAMRLELTQSKQQLKQLQQDKDSQQANFGILLKKKEDEISLINKSFARLAVDLNDYRQKMEAIVKQQRWEFDNLFKEKKQLEKEFQQTHWKSTQLQQELTNSLEEKEKEISRVQLTVDQLTDDLQEKQNQWKKIQEENCADLLKQKELSMQKSVECDQLLEQLAQSKDQQQQLSCQLEHLVKQNDLLKQKEETNCLQLEQFKTQFNLLNLILSTKEDEISSIQANFSRLSNDLIHYQRQMESIVQEKSCECDNLLKENELLTTKLTAFEQIENEIQSKFEIMLKEKEEEQHQLLADNQLLHSTVKEKEWNNLQLTQKLDKKTDELSCMKESFGALAVNLDDYRREMETILNEKEHCFVKLSKDLDESETLCKTFQSDAEQNLQKLKEIETLSKIKDEEIKEKEKSIETLLKDLQNVREENVEQKKEGEKLSRELNSLQTVANQLAVEDKVKENRIFNLVEEVQHLREKSEEFLTTAVERKLEKEQLMKELHRLEQLSTTQNAQQGELLQELAKIKQTLAQRCEELTLVKEEVENLKKNAEIWLKKEGIFQETVKLLRQQRREAEVNANELRWERESLRTEWNAQQEEQMQLLKREKNDLENLLNEKVELIQQLEEECAALQWKLDDTMTQLKEELEKEEEEEETSVEEQVVAAQQASSTETSPPTADEFIHRDILTDLIEELDDFVKHLDGVDADVRDERLSSLQKALQTVTRQSFWNCQNNSAAEEEEGEEENLSLNVSGGCVDYEGLQRALVNCTKVKDLRDFGLTILDDNLTIRANLSVLMKINADLQRRCHDVKVILVAISELVASASVSLANIERHVVDLKPIHTSLLSCTRSLSLSHLHLVEPTGSPSLDVNHSLLMPPLFQQQLKDMANKLEEAKDKKVEEDDEESVYLTASSSQSLMDFTLEQQRPALFGAIEQHRCHVNQLTSLMTNLGQSALR